MANFRVKEGELYIDDKKVLKGYESFSGWYWFVTEDTGTQDSLMPDGTIIENDRIYFGLVQGFEEEWGYFSEGELHRLINKGKLWEIRKHDLPYSGRR
ncbi:hypothetical protein HYR54_15200 [Candidatus Acetothermia bacterium]|nr:hypothetical protein [Candidatus Acetothermia bacterium]